MAKWMKRIAGFSSALCVVFGFWNAQASAGVLLPLAITFGTVAYHFLMRLAVGFAYDKLMDNKADYTRPWFQIRGWEKRLYRFLRVKQWKNRVPSYDPTLFSPDKHTWDEIAQAMCQAELVHETIVLFSFLPMVLSIWWGALGVFAVTSVCAAALDLSFVFIQRFNRPRILRLTEHKH